MCPKQFRYPLQVSLPSPPIPSFQASLGWMLYVLAVKSQRSEALPGDWGLAVVWSLSALALLPLIKGVIWYLTLASRGQIWVKVGAPVCHVLHHG